MIADQQLPPTSRRPGWPELTTALTTYVLGVALLALWIVSIPDNQAILRINVGGIANGLIGCIALFAAFVLRVRDWRAFGFRRTTGKWLLIGAAMGLVAFGLSFIIEGIYFHFITEPNTQADFQLAAKAGVPSLLLLLFTGAILGPIGEELVFRGVIASALNRYGAWISVIGSAALFAVIHGPSVILLDAFMVGVLTGILFRKTGSIWPPIILHIAYNGLHIVYYSML